MNDSIVAVADLVLPHVREGSHATRPDVERIVLATVPEIKALKFPFHAVLQGFYASAPRPNDILEYRYIIRCRPIKGFSTTSATFWRSKSIPSVTWDHHRTDRNENAAALRTPSLGEKARSAIAAMSPAERKLPAYLIGKGSDLSFDFGSADTPRVQRAVRVDPDFWRAHRSRVEVRSITVGFFGVCTKEPPPPEVHNVLWKLHDTMDWRALKKLANEQLP